MTSMPPNSVLKGCCILPGRYGPLRKVPTEIVVNIAIYTRYDDFQALCDATQSLTFEQAKYHRYDIRRYLHTLTPKLDVLLAAMEETGITLSGSRAAAFFYPNACGRDSDWDFYCNKGDVSVARFTYKLFTELGATWAAWSKETDQQLGEVRAQYDGHFNILEGRLNGHKLQLMWYRDTPGSRIFKTVLDFHSSIVQCFITPLCAVSMYHNLSTNDKMMPWEIDGRTKPKKKENAPRCIAKYQARGFELIPYERQQVGVRETAEELDMHENKPWEPRSVTDSGSLIIEFNTYCYDTPITVSLNKPRAPRLRTGINALMNPNPRPKPTTPFSSPTTMHHAAMEEISALRWSEKSDGRLHLRLAKTATWGTYSLLRALEPQYCIYQEEFDYLAEDYEWKTSVKVMLGLETKVEVPWMPVNRLLWDPNAPPYAKVADAKDHTPL